MSLNIRGAELRQSRLCQLQRDVPRMRSRKIRSREGNYDYFRANPVSMNAVIVDYESPHLLSNRAIVIFKGEDRRRISTCRDTARAETCILYIRGYLESKSQRILEQRRHPKAMRVRCALIANGVNGVVLSFIQLYSAVIYMISCLDKNSLRCNDPARGFLLEPILWIS